MEDERVGDICVPLISSFFFLCVLTGGIFLVLYVFFPDLSHPSYPYLALCLIGSPWIFWFFTYIYTGIKACCLVRNPHARQNNRTVSTARAATTTTTTGDSHPQVSVTSSQDSEAPLNASV